MTEFWNTYSQPNGWLWEVLSGGWLDLERRRLTFLSDDVFDLREFFIVDEKCFSVLSRFAPEFESCG